ncbi:ABC transporter substrate-binding protein [Kistimonas scapharcae]|uniref:ABC transporter substrate-binding protein n=1 Tax=Kistimonas scapharcae TaxID=1036133 RepID=A0ABP8UX89_9GAMM
MRHIKYSILTILALLSVLTNNAQASPSPQKQDKPDKITLMLEWFVNPDHGPIIIAQQNGYFAEENLEVTIQEPAEPSLPIKLLAAGEVDMAVIYSEQLVKSSLNQLPVRWAGTLIETPLNCLIVLEDGPIQTLKDLKGKSIGVSLSSGYEKQLLDVMLASSGLSSKDVNVINVGWALTGSLLSKRVDAILDGYRNFELNQLAIEGAKGKAFYVEEFGVPPYSELLFAANSKETDNAIIRRFLRAIEKSSQYIINHPDEAWKAFAAYSPGGLDTPLNKMAWKDTVNRFALRPAAIDRQRFKNYAAYLQQIGAIKKLPNMDTMLAPID